MPGLSAPILLACGNQHREMLVCWGAPLTGPGDPDDPGAPGDFAQRPIESFFRDQKGAWNGAGAFGRAGDASESVSCAAGEEAPEAVAPVRLAGARGSGSGRAQVILDGSACPGDRE